MPAAQRQLFLIFPGHVEGIMIPQGTDPERIWTLVEQVPESYLGVVIPPGEKKRAKSKLDTALVGVVKDTESRELLVRKRVALIAPLTVDEVRTVTSGPWLEVMSLAAPFG